MKKLCFVFACGLLALSSSAQQKSITPLPAIASAKAGQTYAVVVGISDYQDPAIPDLRFAHRDAEEFAAWLQTPAGGNLDSNMIRVLLNEQATIGNLYNVLEWLVDESKEGDRAIIYFSGHGDIEAKTLRKEGFLLCYNSPPNNYRQNAFAVHWLQDIIARLSLIKKAQVIMISDACRAGKLSGQEINGSQLTTAALQEQFSNEIRILSCQPNEYSIEGEQWGGGRGLFSYHLTNGLFGLADRNADKQLKLSEIGRYLEDHVPVEADPMVQNPVVIGDRDAVLAHVDDPTLASYMATKHIGQKDFSPIEMKGFDESIVTLVDSSIKEAYHAFWAALKRKDLMSPSGKSANDYYEILMKAPEMAPLYGLLKRNFIAALIDEAQSITNLILKTDPNVISDSWSRPFVYDHIPAYLERASDLIGENHYLYNTLKAKQLFFEAKSIRPELFPGLPVDSVAKLAVLKFQEALQYDSSAAYIYIDLGFLTFYKTTQFGLALTCAKKALEYSPNWGYAQYLAGNCLQFSDPEKAVYHYEKCIALDSTLLFAYRGLHDLYYTNAKYEKMTLYREKCRREVEALLVSDPENVPAYYLSFLGAFLIELHQYDQAEKILLKAELDSKGQDYSVYSGKAWLYLLKGRNKDALEAANKLIELAPYNVLGYFYLNLCYKRLNQPENGIEILENGIKHIGEMDAFVAFWLRAPLGEAYRALGCKKEAKKQFKKMLKILPEPKNFLEMNFLGRAYLGLGKMHAAQHLFETELKKSEYDPLAYYNVATVYSLSGQKHKALEWLNLALEKGFRELSALEDYEFENIRDTEEFKVLVRKYFPGDYKK